MKDCIGVNGAPHLYVLETPLERFVQTGSLFVVEAVAAWGEHCMTGKSSTSSPSGKSVVLPEASGRWEAARSRMPQHGVKVGEGMFDQRKSLANPTVRPFAGCLCPTACRARRGRSRGSNGHAAGATKWFRPRMAHGGGGGLGGVGSVSVVYEANVRGHRRCMRGSGWRSAEGCPVSHQSPPAAVAAARPGEYIPWAMATNGHKKAPSIKRQPVAKPTAAQQRARAEYVRRSGYKFSQDETDKIRSQWRD